MKRLALLPLLALAACESQERPAACGPIPEVTVNAGETAAVTACFSDPNGDVLVYSAASSNPGVATVSVSGTDITVAAVAPGSAHVTVTASDPGGLEGRQSFQVMVPNRAPQPRGAMPPATVPVGRTEAVDASSYFADPDGETLAYSATPSNPAVATVSVSGSVVTVAAVARGAATVTVTATDPGGLAATQTFDVTVPNRAPEPVGTIADMEVAVDTTASVDVAPSFTDPDGDALVYAASSSSPAVVRVSVSGSAVTARGVAEGGARVTVTARDPEGLAASQTFDVTVTNPDRAVLEELYDALGGSSWTTKTNWKTDAHLDTWFGVTANEDERVVRLELPDNGLTGRVPPELGDLSSLERLFVHDNPRLSGPLPTALGSLGNLARFYYTTTNLCVPADDSFRRWLNGIDDHRGTGVDCFRRLTNNSAIDEHPAWSPDGTRIAFQSYRDGNYEIYVMDDDGGNQTRLTNNSARDERPAWSPDGTRIAFESNRDGNTEIYAMDDDGGNVDRLTNNSASDGGAAWSPDGTRIAFYSNRDGWEIYAMDDDGGNVDRLTDNSATDAGPAWSPDGTRIAFESNRDGNYEIYAMDDDGGNQTRLTNDRARDSGPAWSPDGTRIAFHSTRDGNFEIYAMDDDGGNQTRLTNDRALDAYPEWWSPDGTITVIAFYSNRDGGEHEIYVMAAR